MTIAHTITLGGVQGITEFIPVSSSGHLILAERFLDIPNNFTFGVLLNIGTLIALFIFFRKPVIELIKQVFVERELKYFFKLLLAVVPTFVVGFLFSDYFDSLGEHLWLVALSLVIFGVAMIVAGKLGRESDAKDEEDISFSDSVMVGLAQVLALVPGVSRSGITILAGLNRGFSIKTATDFSFLMAAPTILGAVVHTLFFNDGLTFISNNMTAFLVGNLASFTLGFLAVKTLVMFLKKYGLVPFGWYRIGLGTLLGVLLLTNVL